MPQRHPPERKRRWRWVLGGIAALFMALVYAFFKDDALEVHSDLAITDSPPTPQGQAAYMEWVAAAALVDMAPLRSSYDADPLFAERLLGFVPWAQNSRLGAAWDRNHAALEAAIRADALGPFELPKRSAGGNFDFQNTFLQLRKILLVFASAKLVSGDHEKAAQLALVHLRMGESLIKQNGGLTTLIQDLEIYESSLRALDRIDAGNARKDVLELLHPSISVELDLHAAFDHTIRYEFATIGSQLDSVKNGDANFDAFHIGGDQPPTLFFKRNRTHNEAADFFRAVLREAAQPVSTRKPLPYRSPPTGLAFVSSNAFGNYLHASLGTVHTTVPEVIDFLTAFRRMLKTKVALLRHRKGTDTLPATLAGLIPTYLDAVPLDPYDGKPLRYDPARGAVWVVGKDFTDNGGAPAPDSKAAAQHAPDPTLFLDPPKP